MVYGNATPRSIRLRIAILALVWLGSAGLAGYDVHTKSSADRVRAEQELLTLGEVVADLRAAEVARVDGELARIRAELNAQGVWQEPGALSAAADLPTPDPEATSGSEDTGEMAARRLDASLRQILMQDDSLASVDLIVAGAEGVHVFGLERDAEREPASRGWAPEEREGVAKSLWYAGEVSRAVQSAGRQVAHGEIDFEGPGERPVARAAIGLHENAQLVQGALVAAVDLTGFAERLARLAPESGRITLTNADGRPLDPSLRHPAIRERWASLAPGVLETREGREFLESEDMLVLGRPLVRPENDLATMIVWIEEPVPPTGFAALLESAWPVPLALFAGVVGLVIQMLLRVSARLQSLAEAEAEAARRASEPGPDPIEVQSEPMVLRDWLGDVRGCLEREAATRGLAIDVQCQSSLPVGIQSDPGWLGGLVVAMGREALDATDQERVVVAVSHEGDDALRVEVDAGGVSLAPVGGMLEVAGGIGARLEAASQGGLALVVPAAIS